MTDDTDDGGSLSRLGRVALGLGLALQASEDFRDMDHAIEYADSSGVPMPDHSLDTAGAGADGKARDGGSQIGQRKVRGDVAYMKTKAEQLTPTRSITKRTSQKEAELSATYIRSEYSNSIHVVPSGAMLGPASEWPAACRWRFARPGKYEIVAADALGERCDRCCFHASRST